MRWAFPVISLQQSAPSRQLPDQDSVIFVRTWRCSGVGTYTQASHAKTTALSGWRCDEKENILLINKLSIGFPPSGSRETYSFDLFFSFLFFRGGVFFLFFLSIFHILPSFCAALLATRFLFLAATGFLQLFSGSRCPSGRALPSARSLTIDSNDQEHANVGWWFVFHLQSRDETTSPLVSRKKQTVNLTASKR